jgi:hypothetical protein
LPLKNLKSIRVDQTLGSKTDAKRRNYFIRHWQGDLALPISYWVNGFLGNVVAAVAIAIIAVSTDFKDDFRPALALASVIAIWAVLFGITVWQVVGVWRSATKYRYVRLKRFWGGCAKLLVVLGVLQIVGQFARSGVPQMSELYAIVAGDQEFGKYSFRVLRDGEELEFSGGITFGGAKEFERFIDAMGAVKVIHLNSPGGRVLEAQRMGALATHRYRNRRSM